MATEKQISYIKNLIDRNRIENRNLPGYHSQRRAVLLNAVGINEFDERYDDVDVDGAAELYNARIAQLESTDWMSIDNQAVSALIDSLKAWGLGYKWDFGSPKDLLA